MFNVSCSIQIFYVLTQLVSLIESTKLGRVIQLNLINFVWRIKYIHYISPFLIPAKYLYSDVLPFTSTWKMVKYAPNHIPTDTIDSAQTSHKIIEDGDILILPVILITPKDLWISV